MKNKKKNINKLKSLAYLLFQQDINYVFQVKLIFHNLSIKIYSYLLHP